MIGPAALVLASASPRRVDLLRSAGFDFGVEAADIDESVRPAESGGAYAPRMSLAKAVAVASRPDHADAAADPLVIGADTIVVLDGAILGKPTDAAAAEHMLRRLSGRRHEVLTSVSVVRRDSTGGLSSRTGTSRTTVWFRDLDASVIERYVATGEPLDKAGSYAIQGGGADFVDRIDGPHDNVVGLPIALVRDLLTAMGHPGRPD